MGDVKGNGHDEGLETRVQRSETEIVLLRRDLTAETAWRMGLDDTIGRLASRMNECANIVATFAQRFTRLDEELASLRKDLSAPTVFRVKKRHVVKRRK